MNSMMIPGKMVVDDTSKIGVSGNLLDDRTI